MSNVQLYLSIGIPTFTVILAQFIALFQNNRLADKFDRVADRLNDRIDATNKEVASLSKEIASMRAEHHADFKMLMEQIVRLNERIAKVEG